MNNEEVEKEVQSRGLTAPRVTLQDVDAAAVLKQFHRFESTTVTVCCLTLANGFCVVGESAAASPENFDEELGRKIAEDCAKDKLWMLLGFRLRDELHAAVVRGEDQQRNADGRTQSEGGQS